MKLGRILRKEHLLAFSNPADILNNEPWMVIRFNIIDVIIDNENS